MVVHVRTRWLATFVLVALGVSALIRLHFGVTGRSAALAVVPVVVVHRMRLTADELGRDHREPSRAAASVDPRSATSGWTRRPEHGVLTSRRRDGSRVHAWAVTTGGVAANRRRDRTHPHRSPREHLARHRRVRRTPSTPGDREPWRPPSQGRNCRHPPRRREAHRCEALRREKLVEPFYRANRDASHVTGPARDSRQP